MNLACASSRRALHSRLDGLDLDRGDEDRLRGHLLACEACRALEADLDTLRRELRAAAKRPFPDEALERVWSRTIRSREWRRGSLWRGAGLGTAAALALAASLSLWQWTADRRSSAVARQEADAEVERAAAQARLVLGMAAGALDRAEQLAIREVLVDDIGPALRRVPVRWPVAREAKGDKES